VARTCAHTTNRANKNAVVREQRPENCKGSDGAVIVIPNAIASDGAPRTARVPTAPVVAIPSAVVSEKRRPKSGKSPSMLAVAWLFH